MTLLHRLAAVLLAAGLSLPAQAEAHRIIVISSSLAEIVVALGEAPAIVGRGAGSDHIPEIAEAARFPGYRQASAEGMLSLAPTLALMSARRTPPTVKQQLEAAGVAVHLFEEATSLDEIPVRVERIADLLGRKAEAGPVIARFEAERAAALALVAGATRAPRGLFLLGGGGRPFVVAGGDTHIGALIKLAGGVNVAEEISSFKPLSAEVMITAAPEFILVNEQALETVNGAMVALNAPGVAMTPAAKTGTLFALPSGYLTDLGLASPAAIEALARKIHPELD